MAVTTMPNQERTIDPFSSYYSDVANRITRIVSNNKNCIFSAHAVEVISDPLDPLTNVIIGIGQVFKSDVLIEITEPFNIDLEDPDFFLGSTGMNNTGYHYIVLKYNYERARPAPTASIKVLKPAERSLYSQESEFLFLKCIKVIFNGTKYIIDELLDHDPDSPANQRMYSPLFAGVENSLPSFNATLHEAKIIYIRSANSLYFGSSTGWENFSADPPGFSRRSRDITEWDSTPSILNGSGLRCGILRTDNNTGATTITNIDDGYDDMMIVLLFNDINTTVENNININLTDGYNFKASYGDSLTLVYSDSSQLWTEIGRQGSEPSVGFTKRSRNVDIGDITPSILDSESKQCGVLNIDNTSSITITNIDDGINNMIIILLFHDGNTTIQHNSNISLSEEYDFKAEINNSLSLVYNSNYNKWFEIGRQSAETSVGFAKRSRNVDIGDTTPSILDSDNKQCGVLNIDNTSSTTITNIDDAEDGMMVILLFHDDNTIVEHFTNINLSDKTNFEAKANDTLTLIYDSNNSRWLEPGGRLNHLIGFAKRSRSIYDGDTTPGIMTGYGRQHGILHITNTAPTTITDFDNYVDDMLIVLLFNDNYTTIENNSDIQLLGGSDYKANINDSLSFVRDSNNNRWIEVGRESQILILPEQTAKPVALANTGFVYAKEVTGIAELFYEDENGKETQLTKDGEILKDSINFPAFISTLLDDTSASEARTTLGVDVAGLPRSYLAGFTLIRESTVLIGINAGECRDSGNDYDFKISSKLTKRIDVSWAAGNGNGGFFPSGSAAPDVWYHVFAIRKDSDGSIDAGFDPDISAVNIPGGYTAYRRIGSVLTDGSANIIKFRQIGNDFMWDVAFTELNTTVGSAAVLLSIHIPPDIKFLAHLAARLHSEISGACSLLLSDPDIPDTVPGYQNFTIYNYVYDAGGSGSQANCTSNTSQQIRYRFTLSGYTAIQTILSYGYQDLRGKND